MNPRGFDVNPRDADHMDLKLAPDGTGRNDDSIENTFA